MLCYWPADRFIKAAHRYTLDFKCVLTTLTDNESMIIKLDRHLLIEHDLISCIGRAIRFHLRKFFNSVPLPLTTNHKVDSSVRSRVHERLEIMMDEKGNRDTAASDGSLSSIFTVALRQVYEYFGMQNCLSEDHTPEMPRRFCNSPASLRGLGEKGSHIILKQHDVDQVILDIEDAHIFLTTARACKFIFELMTCPGVKEEIERIGGWSTVKRFGQTIVEFHLHRACQNDAYFALLCDIDAFTDRISRYHVAMESAVHICENSLEKLWSRFRCASQTKSFLARNPLIVYISDELLADKTFKFPTISTR